MGRLILVRHGETQANREKRFAISGDIPLTELGRQQARQAAGRIAMLFQPQRIFSSSFRRARETGEIIGEVIDLPVEILEGIQERDLGILKGELYGYLPVVAKASKDYDPARFWQWRPEGGESHEDVQIRMVSALQRVRHDYPDQQILIVSHGAAIRSFCAHLANRWEGVHPLDNCGIVVLDHQGGEWAAPVVMEQSDYLAEAETR